MSCGELRTTGLKLANRSEEGISAMASLYSTKIMASGGRHGSIRSEDGLLSAPEAGKPAQAIKKDIMIKDFNVSEKGHGSYWLLGILRWVMVLIFISFGIQKFTPESAQGIAFYISNSPFVSWLSNFGIRGEANLLGIIELTTAALLAAGAFIPILSALGSLMGIGTFAITWSFFFSTPGVVKWSVSTDPIAWNLAGEFLYKDVVLLCVCIVLFLASLPKRVVRLRSD
jgi:uncharacterized membrane protein YkgB